MSERKILFRGKRIDNGKWVEGFYYKMKETTYAFAEDYKRNPVPTHHYILFEQMTDWGMSNQLYQVEVDPETVCQYIGLADKNSRKIFRGDICEIHSSYIDEEDGYFVVEWDEYCAKTILSGEDLEVDFDLFSGADCKVVGNIYDNPELIDSGGASE